ncbi:hypothetical protein MMC14_009126 [Varicellaria rhodocarpa]|nr:hypothetical protein [Varicellaria rhodocarpa]
MDFDNLTIDKVTDRLLSYANDWQRNLSHTFSRLTLQQYLRLLIMVCAYMLLRPYLVKLGGKFQAKDHERELDPDEMRSSAAISPNSLRGQVEVPEDSDSEGENEPRMGTGTSVSWGKKARKRQRYMIRKLVEAEEKRRAEEEEADSDQEIQEFLVG